MGFPKIKKAIAPLLLQLNELNGKKITIHTAENPNANAQNKLPTKSPLMLDTRPSENRKKSKSSQKRYKCLKCPRGVNSEVMRLRHTRLRHENLRGVKTIDDI